MDASSDPEVVAQENVADVSGSLLELFEYVDNVTKSFDAGDNIEDNGSTGNEMIEASRDGCLDEKCEDGNGSTTDVVHEQDTIDITADPHPTNSTADDLGSPGTSGSLIAVPNGTGYSPSMDLTSKLVSNHNIDSTGYTPSMDLTSKSASNHNIDSTGYSPSIDLTSKPVSIHNIDSTGYSPSMALTSKSASNHNIDSTGYSPSMALTSKSASNHNIDKPDSSHVEHPSSISTFQVMNEASISHLSDIVTKVTKTPSTIPNKNLHNSPMDEHPSNISTFKVLDKVGNSMSNLSNCGTEVTKTTRSFPNNSLHTKVVSAYSTGLPDSPVVEHPSCISTFKVLEEASLSNLSDCVTKESIRLSNPTQRLHPKPVSKNIIELYNVSEFEHPSSISTLKVLDEMGDSHLLDSVRKMTSTPCSFSRKSASSHKTCAPDLSEVEHPSSLSAYKELDVTNEALENKKPHESTAAKTIVEDHKEKLSPDETMLQSNTMTPYSVHSISGYKHQPDKISEQFDIGSLPQGYECDENNDHGVSTNTLSHSSVQTSHSGFQDTDYQTVDDVDSEDPLCPGNKNKTIVQKEPELDNEEGPSEKCKDKGHSDIVAENKPDICAIETDMRITQRINKVLQSPFGKRLSNCVSDNLNAVDKCTDIDKYSTPIKKNKLNHHKKIQEVKENNIYLKDHDTQVTLPKKRHLSTKADIEITPKRHKLEDALSPIENALSLRKERGVDEALVETPVVYCRNEEVNDDCRTPVNSTPVVTDHRNTRGLDIRKAIWKADCGEHMDYMTSYLLPQDEDERKVVFKNDHVVGSGEDIYRDQNEIDANHHDFESLKQDSDHLDGTVTNQPPPTAMEPTSITPSKDHRTVTIGLHACSKSHISITDSSYFAENTSRVEGRFKDVEATISIIDVDKDEDDLLLSADVLGLESGYDDSDIDEETLLGDSADENEKDLSVKTCENKENVKENMILKETDSPEKTSVTPSRDQRANASRYVSDIPITDGSYFAENTSRVEGRFKNLEATISIIDVDEDEDDLLLSADVLGLESGYDDSDIDEETLLGDSGDEKENHDLHIKILKSKEAVSENVVLREINSQEMKKSVQKLESKDCVAAHGDHLPAIMNDNETDTSKDIVESSICTIKVDKIVDKIETTENLTHTDNFHSQTTASEIDNEAYTTKDMIGEIDTDTSEDNYLDLVEEIPPSHQEVISNVVDSTEPVVVKVSVDIDKTLTDSTSQENHKDDLKNDSVSVQKAIVVEIDKETVKQVSEVKDKENATNKEITSNIQTNQNTVIANSNTNNSNCNILKKTIDITPVHEQLFLECDTNNEVMKDVMRKWNCDKIPSQDVNLTVAATYHKNHSKQNESKNSPSAQLEGEKISCLNFYEDEMNTKHQTMNHCSLNQASGKLRKQKEDLDSMKLMALEALEQDCYQRCEVMRARHRKEYEQLRRRQSQQYNNIRNQFNVPPFVKQQQLVQLGIEHSQEQRRMSDHHRCEFETLSGHLQEMFHMETQHHEEQVAPVEMLISQVEKMKRESSGTVDKYGPTVLMYLRKRPCKENHYKTSTDEVCLPVMIAQALSHEEDIYNHFYKF